MQNITYNHVIKKKSQRSTCYDNVEMLEIRLLEIGKDSSLKQDT